MKGLGTVVACAVLVVKRRACSRREEAAGGMVRMERFRRREGEGGGLETGQWLLREMHAEAESGLSCC